jgi:pyridoxamine 5'-phosphate oxidase
VDFEAITDPLAALDEFRARAEKAAQVLPEAMTLATIGLDGRPRARVVLFKGRLGRGVHFYSNYRSEKAKELERSPYASLCIHYAGLQLQARLEGKVERLSASESDAYFATRPRVSQIGAWASKQSEVLDCRATLDEAFEREEARFVDQEVPRPPHWGGFSLVVDKVELWVGQGGRLHDRARYEYGGANWTCARLYP